MTDRAGKLMKLLRRLIKQDHLYSEEQLIQMKSQLRVLEEELSNIRSQTSKGFGNK